jgi:putative peptidoglycan binding protein
MTVPKGSPCPECGTPRRADNTPSCPCGRRAADALLATRTAEAAAAEDFDPLRIRPYVDLTGDDDGDGGGDANGNGAEDGGGGRATCETGGTGEGTGPGTDASAATSASGGAGGTEPGPGPGAGAGVDTTLGAKAGARTEAGSAPETPDTVSDAGTGTEPSAGTEPYAGGAPVAGSSPDEPDAGTAPDVEATTELRRVDGDGAAAPLVPDAETTRELRRIAGAPDVTLPTPLAPATSGPRAADLRLFEPGRSEPHDDAHTDSGAVPRRRNRRTVLLSVAGAAVATVAVAGFASGLFSYRTPTRDGAAPEDVRVGVPDRTTAAPTTKAATTPASTFPTDATTSASTSPSPSVSPTPSASRSSAAPSATPSSRPSEATPTATPTHPTGSATPVQGPVLQIGDHGPEVTELQLRLRQLNLYWNDPNGRFDKRLEDSVRTYQWSRGITADEPGVYGPATRAALESETSQP